MHQHKLWHLLFVFFFFFGCATNCPVDNSKGERFESSVKDWTAKGRIYKNLELLLSAGATYLAPELRKAYVDKFALDHSLSAAEKERKVEEEQKQVDDGLEFIVYLSSDKDSWDNLGEKNSIWTLTLTDHAGHKVKPKAINQIDPVPIYITDFFPAMTHWKKVYSVVFPKKPEDSETYLVLDDSRGFTLVFRSAIGHLSLAFK